MESPARILDEELNAKVAHLNQGNNNEWNVIEGKLQKSFVFKNFTQAMGFMVQAGIEAEKMNHHPEWLNIYKTVDVRLVTHSSGGITDLDFTLAQKFDALVS